MDIIRPSMETKELLDEYLRYNRYRSCEFCAANSLFWGDFSNTGFVILADMLVFCRMKGGVPVSFTFPVGAHDPRYAFDKVADYFHESGLPFVMYMVQPEMFALIETWYPGRYRIAYDRDAADYLYTYETLANLSGKKLHAKRNHIHRFTERYPDYRYEKINGKNREECLQLADRWAAENNPENDPEKIQERKNIAWALENPKLLGLIGGLIRADGGVVAFTIGERLTEDTFVVHFEKAIADIQGAYAMINREFVRHELTGYKYINREEDMGIPGLRKAKLSYQPVALVEKGLVTVNNL